MIPNVGLVLVKLFFAQYWELFVVRQPFQRQGASLLILLPIQAAVIPGLARPRRRAAWLLPRILTDRSWLHSPRKQHQQTYSLSSLLLPAATAGEQSAENS
jgi:hypothetical protein